MGDEEGPENSRLTDKITAIRPAVKSRFGVLRFCRGDAIWGLGSLTAAVRNQFEQVILVRGSGSLQGEPVPPSRESSAGVPPLLWLLRFTPSPWLASCKSASPNISILPMNRASAGPATSAHPLSCRFLQGCHLGDPHMLRPDGPFQEVSRSPKGWTRCCAQNGESESIPMFIHSLVRPILSGSILPAA